MNHRSRSHLGSGSALPSVFDTMSEPDYEGDHRSESCPFHKARCPLTLCIFGERRWPGSDGFITVDDKNFLDSLTPKPVWWLRAWGRTE